MISPAPPRYSGAAPATIGKDIVRDGEKGNNKIETTGAPGGFAGLGIEVTGSHSVIDMDGVNSITMKFMPGLTAADFLFVA